MCGGRERGPGRVCHSQRSRGRRSGGGGPPLPHFHLRRRRDARSRATHVRTHARTRTCHGRFHQGRAHGGGGVPAAAGRDGWADLDGGAFFPFSCLPDARFFSGAPFPRGPSRAGGRPRPGRTQCRIRVCACAGMHTHKRNATAHPGAPLTSLTAFLSFLSRSHRAPARGSAWAPRPGPPHPRPPHPPTRRRARRVRSWKRCATLWGERERRARVAGGA